MKQRGFSKHPPTRQILPFRMKGKNNIVNYPVTGGDIQFDKDTGTVIGCDWRVKEALIPEEIEGVPVTAIGDCAFQNPFCYLANDRIRIQLVPSGWTE